MPRKTAHDFDQELLILFDAYVHGAIDRRAFLERAARFAVGGVTAAMLLEQLSPRFAEAQLVPLDDRRITQEYVEFDSPAGYGKGRGYLARPAGGAGPHPGVLVIHENRTPVGPPSSRPSRRRGRPTSATCTPARSMASTTTPRRATTRRPPRWRGSAPSRS